MKIHERGSELILRDSPGAYWLLGGMFVVLGGTFVVGPLGLFYNAEVVGPVGRAVVVTMGAIGVVAGVWVLARAPRSIVRCDRARRIVTVERRGLFRMESLVYAGATVAGLSVEEERDDEGSPVYRPYMVLRTGERVLLSPLWQHGRDASDLAVARVAECLALPPPGPMP